MGIAIGVYTSATKNFPCDHETMVTPSGPFPMFVSHVNVTGVWGEEVVSNTLQLQVPFTHTVIIAV